MYRTNSDSRHLYRNLPKTSRSASPPREPLMRRDGGTYMVHETGGLASSPPTGVCVACPAAANATRLHVTSGATTSSSSGYCARSDSTIIKSVLLRCALEWSKNCASVSAAGLLLVAGPAAAAAAASGLRPEAEASDMVRAGDGSSWGISSKRRRAGVDARRDRFGLRIEKYGCLGPGSPWPCRPCRSCPFSDDEAREGWEGLLRHPFSPSLHWFHRLARRRAEVR